MPKKKEEMNLNDTKGKELHTNGPNEEKNEGERLTKDIIERNKEWAKKHSRKHRYTSD